MFIQVLICRDKSEMVCYIPAEMAVKDKVISIKSGGEWQGGWIVKDVYSTITDEELNAQREDKMLWRQIKCGCGTQSECCGWLGNMLVSR